MANQIRYQVGFNVNKNDLNQLKSSLQQIQKVKLDDIMKINKTDMNSARDALKSIQEDASKVENALNKAFNTKLNTLNIDKFNKQLSSSNLTIQKVYQSFSRAGTVGQSAFNNLSTQILNTNVQLRQSNKLLDSMATSMANTVKWGITSSVFNNMTRSIQQAYYYAKDLDRSLTNIRIVTGDSADQMQKFATIANSAAKELGRSTLDYTKASLTFYQQGLDDQQVAARTEATLKAQNITGIGTEMADYLTAVWNGFNVGAEEAEQYVDKLAAVADSTASDMGQLATAMSKVASAANSIGVDMDQLNGQIATVIATTRQAPESVGAAFKTIYARINDIQAGTEDAQVSLGNYSGKMAALGVNVLDATGHLRDTGEVIEEIGGKWQDLTREQQINLAQTMAGQRQYNNLIALFDNWDKYLQSVNTSMNAQGTLNEKNGRYLESLEAHMQQLGAQAERTYDILFDENAVKGWVDALDSALGIFNDFIDGLGGGANAFAYFGTTVASIFNKQIAQGIQGVGAEIQRVLSNIDAFNTKSKVIEQIKSGLQVQYAGEGTTLGNTALTAQAEAAQKTLAVQKGLTTEQQKQAVQIQKQIGLTQQKVNDLQKQNQNAKEIIKSLEQEQVIRGRSITLLQQDQQQLQYSYDTNKKSLTVMEGIEQSLEKINSGTLSWQQQGRLTDTIIQQMENQTENLKDTWIASGGSAKEFKNHIEIVKGYLSGTITDSEKFKQSWQAIKSVTQEYANNQKADLEKIDLYLKNIEIDTSKLTEEEKKKLAVLLQQNDALAEQGRKTLNLQTLIKGVSAAGMALTSIGGGLSTALADGATAADKLNGRFTAINGTVGALLTMIPGIGPALNIVWQGVSSIGKAILQATGIWDKFEDRFKSTKQKVDELNASISKVNQNDKTKNAQINNLEAVVEEYEKLSEKAGDYGIYLDNLTQQEQDRYHQITNSFTEYNDAVIAGYDEQGNAIVKGQDALKDTIEVLKQAKIQADKAALGNKGSFLKGISARHTKENNERYNILNREQEKVESNFADNFSQGLGQASLSTIRGSLDTFSTDFAQIYLEVEDKLKYLDNLTLQQSELLGDQFKQLYQKFVDDVNTAIENGDNKLLQQTLKQGSEYRDLLRTATGDQTLLSQYDAIFEYLPTEKDVQDYLNKIKGIEDNRKKLDEQIANQTYSYEDANALITGLQVYDNETWSIIESELKQMGIGTSGFIKDLSNFITNQNISTDINDLYTLIQQKAESYAQILISYGDSIREAEQNAVEDAKNIFEKKSQTAKGLNQTIQKSITENFLNDEVIKSLLADAKNNPEYKNFLESLISSIYNLEDIKIKFDKKGNAYIAELQTQKDKINAEISEVLLSNEKITDGIGQYDNKLLDEYLQGLNIDNDTLLAVKTALQDPALTFESLQEAVGWVNNFIQQSDRQMDIEPIIEKFDKISAAIKKIQSGKNLNWKQKNNLAQALNLTPEQLAKLDSNADWLEKITEKVYTTLNPENIEESTARKQAFIDLYPTLQALNQAYQTSKDIKDGMAMTADQYADVWEEVYQNELQQLNINEQALKDYAEAKGLAFEDKKDKEAVLKSYQDKQTYNKLGQALENVKEKMDNFNGSAEDAADSELGPQLQNILSLLRDLGAEDISLQWLINNFDALKAAAEGDIEAFKELINQKQELLNPQTETTTSIDRYEENKTNVDNLEGASKSLTDKSAMSQDQSAALGEILAIDQNLAKIAEQQGINSEVFLEALNAIIEAKKQELQIDKQAALAENERDIKTAEMIKKSAEIRGHTEKVTEQEKILNDLYAQRAQLMQQTSDTEQQQPKFDEDINVQELEHLSDTIQQIAQDSDELDESLATNEDAADELSQAILRFDDACKDVSENYENWMAALNSGSLQEQVEAMDELRDAYGDLLDLDGSTLSQDFLSNTDNLDLMKAAIDGDVEAYNELLDLAGQDIAVQIGLDANAFEADKEAIYDAILDFTGQDFGDIQVGAQLNDQKFLASLSEMVNAANMTQKQATDYLAAMGVDAQIVQTKAEAKDTHEYTNITPNVDTVDVESVDPTTGQPITYKFPSVSYNVTPAEVDATKENSAFALKVVSANKASGGSFKFKNAANGGGTQGSNRRNSSPKRSSGSGKPKGSSSKKPQEEKQDTSTKDRKKGLEDQRDIYHDINIQIQQINRSLSRTQKMQDRLYGKQLLDNLAKQQQLLQKQKVTLREKQKIQEKDLENQQQTLKNLGVTFDQYNNISNYMSILGQKQAEINARIDQYNAIVDAYNASTDKDQKEKIQQTLEAVDKEIKLLEDQKKNIESKIKDYDDLRENMEDLKDKIEEATQQQIEIQIKKFRMNVEIRLELGQAERDWNKFRKQVLERPDYMTSVDFDSIFANATQSQRDLASYFKVGNSIGSIQTLTKKLWETKAAIDQIDKVGTSAIYGDNKALAMEHLQKDLDELMQQLENVEDLIEAIDKAYLDTIDDIQKNFDKQIEDYEFIGDLIDHDIDLLTILYGDKNYDAMEKYYTALEQNNNKTLDSLKKQAAFLKEQWQTARANGDAKAAEKFEAAYKKTIKTLNSQIQESAKIIQQKYENAINNIYDTLDKKISNGKGTDYLSMEWQLMNKNEEQYLDTINSAFAIQETQRKYNRALNETKSIKNQQALKKLMDEQLGILKNKNKLTQYDIDRAEKLLQIEQARIALEQTRSSKTSMRLKRNSQGDYSYEYMADQGALGDAEENLAKAQNDLYNFDKDAYRQNLEDMLSAWKEFLSKRKEILLDNNLTEAQQKEQLALLDIQYGEYINDKTEQNLAIRGNLTESAFMDIAEMYNTDVNNYRNILKNINN